MRWVGVLSKVLLLALMTGVMAVPVSGAASGVVAFGAAALPSVSDTLPPAQEPWEAAMQAFEEQDRNQSWPPQTLFFTGSSSILLWRTMTRDMAPFPVVNRGFGGSNMTDVVRLADRYIAPHTFAALVLFVANDIRGVDDDKTPEEARDLFDAFIAKVRGYNAEAPIFIIAITPTQSRWRVWSEIRRLNGYLAELSDRYEQVIFVPTEDLFLGADGLPSEHLFVSDQLHLSEEGYAVWARRLRSYIVPVMSGRE